MCRSFGVSVRLSQSYGTRAEVLNIILSPRQVVSPQANKPVMGIVQDTLLGVMKFTFRDNFITRDLTFNILMHLESWDGRVPVPAILKPQPMWTGKQLFSCLLPKINMAHTCFPAGEHRVLTNRGFLFLDEIKAHEARGETVTFACYDVPTAGLVYRPALQLNDSPFDGKLVDFTPAAEQAAWQKGATEYGEPANQPLALAKATQSNHLSVVVTPNHKMYAQFGEATSRDQVRWYGAAEGDLCPYVKQRADRLVPGEAEPLPNALAMDPRAKARAKPDTLRFLAFAQGGIGDVVPGRLAAALDSLCLSSSAAVLDFLRVYGFWLGNGTLDCRGFIRFQQVSAADVEFLQGALGRLLDQSEWRRSDSESTTAAFDVTAARWFAFFGSSSPASVAAAASLSVLSVGHGADKPIQSLAPFVRDCTREQLRAIVDGLQRADGAWTPSAGPAAPRTNVIYTSSAQFRDELLDLMVRAGYSTYFRLHAQKGQEQGVNQQGVPTVAPRDAWAVMWGGPEEEASVAAAVQVTMPRKEITDVDYRGVVWCPTVDHPDSLIVVQRAHRHNGVVTKASKPIIVGNSNNHPDNEEGIMSVGDTLVLVEMGELIQGTIDKRTVSGGPDSTLLLPGAPRFPSFPSS